MLFDAHTRSFAALGGVARRGIYDNMKTAVDKVKKGKGRVVNARFAAMCSHYLFDADFCNVASGWEKGVVEKNVQDSRRRVWLQARERKFTSFAELNAWLAERCKAVWADTPHPEHRELSIAELAGHCGTSERSLLRHFRQHYGVSPLAHIQHLRVERAKALLESTLLSFDEIVERCGYSDPSSFRKLFKRATSLTPADYRERFRLRPS
jgi:AraC-like DNA-binding protein